MTLALRVLLGIAALLCVAGLLIMNDLTTIWPGAEAALLAASVDGGSNWLPQLLLHQLLAVDTPLFGLRLPSVLLFSVLLVVSYLWSKPLFGHMTALLTSWLLAASLLLPTLAKMAIAESYAVVFQWLTMLALLRFLKQPTLFWRLSFYGLWAVALWVQFLGSALMLLFMAVYLQFKHKEGKRLVGLYFWLVPVVVGGITWAINGLGYPLNPGFAYNHWNSNPLEFLGYNILGVLPFCGFVLAGIWESIQRVKKKEELAIIYVALLVGALV
ncbi:MAG: glycosyltransferase family 39 protein, partial [Bacteroidota bacterium]